MGGGEALPGFPHPNPVDSYWQLPPHRIANHRTTESLPSTVFDYVIIGSGVSGAAVAHKLLTRDPSLSILMLEARTAASAASGRNGGHCRPGRWLAFKKYAENYGEDEALRLEALEEGNVRDIADFVKTYNVDCDFRTVETSDTFTKQESWDKILDLVHFRQELYSRRPETGEPPLRNVLHGEDAQKTLGMDKLVGAVTYQAHTQNPYLLVCKMLELSLEKGLNLQTNTLATKIFQHGSNWHVQTDRGVVQGQKVVLATTSYTNAIHPGLADTGFLTPSRSQVTAIRPGSKITGNPSLIKRSCGLNDLGYGDYFMAREAGLRGEGDILYGGGNAVDTVRGIIDDSEVNPKIAEYLQHAAYDFFGAENWGKEGDVVMDWVGITSYTPDSFPIVGESPDQKDLWMSVGMNGHGSK